MYIGERQHEVVVPTYEVPREYYYFIHFAHTIELLLALYL